MKTETVEKAISMVAQDLRDKKRALMDYQLEYAASRYNMQNPSAFIPDYFESRRPKVKQIKYDTNGNATEVITRRS